MEGDKGLEACGDSVIEVGSHGEDVRVLAVDMVVELMSRGVVA